MSTRPVAPRIRVRSIAPTTTAGRVLIVSNRLPITARIGDGVVRLEPSCGGLATGLGDIHRRSHALWLGWAGTPTPETSLGQRALDRALRAAGTVGVALDADEVAAYYQRFATASLWPRLHDLTDHPAPTADDWATYQAVNARFADTTATHLRHGDRVWVHDYHLMLVPRLVRERRPDARIGFFLHTPFPSPHAVADLPQWSALLDGLLGADVIGFQTRADADRFIAAAVTRRACVAAPGGLAVGGRQVAVRACPIGVDAGAFAARAADPGAIESAWRRRRDGESLMVGIDRLDYTKGIPQRLAAFERLLEDRPEWRARVRLFQLAVPSRDEVPAYRTLRASVERTVERINARFGTAAWLPVEYVHGTVDAMGLAALYRAADVMLVTPLRDGMNLVAKEFVASRVDDDGVLILGEHAGAAAELRTALLVDPRDVAGMASAYERALTMSAAERRVRMRRLRGIVRRHDVFQWSREFLLALGGEGGVESEHAG